MKNQAGQRKRKSPSLTQCLLGNIGKVDFASFRALKSRGGEPRTETVLELLESGGSVRIELPRLHISGEPGAIFRQRCSGPFHARVPFPAVGYKYMLCMDFHMITHMEMTARTFARAHVCSLTKPRGQS